jgi:hypothetical protein
MRLEMDLTKRNVEIVIARYKEDISWSTPYAKLTTVYCKNEADRSPGQIQLPNRGQDPGTYLYHMVTRYNSLANRTIFLQGNPFEHKMLTIDEMITARGDFITVYDDDMRSWEKPYTWGFPASPVNGTPPGSRTLSLATKQEWWDEYVGGEYPVRHAHNWGQQFAVSAAAIRQRGRNYLRSLYEVSQQSRMSFGGVEVDNYEICVLLEISWPYIFGARR